MYINKASTQLFFMKVTIAEDEQQIKKNTKNPRIAVTDTQINQFNNLAIFVILTKKF